MKNPEMLEALSALALEKGISEDVMRPGSSEGAGGRGQLVLQDSRRVLGLGESSRI